MSYLRDILQGYLSAGSFADSSLILSGLDIPSIPVSLDIPPRYPMIVMISFLRFRADILSGLGIPSIPFYQ